MSSYELNSTAKANEALAAIGGTGFGSNSIQLLKQLVVAAGVYRSNQFVGPLTGSESEVLDGWSISRLLTTNYSGNLLELRNSSTNSDLNIGTVNGFLDTSTAASHVGANNGAIKSVYSQFGGANWINNNVGTN